jgi:hypothetical protein
MFFFKTPTNRFGGRKAPSSMGKTGTAGVPSATLGTGSSDSAPQARLSHVSLRSAPLRMTILRLLGDPKTNIFSDFDVSQIKLALMGHRPGSQEPKGICEG